MANKAAKNENSAEVQELRRVRKRKPPLKGEEGHAQRGGGVSRYAGYDLKKPQANSYKPVSLLRRTAPYGEAFRAEKPKPLSQP